MIIHVDKHFVRMMADVHLYPDHVRPVRPDDKDGFMLRLQAAIMCLTGRADALIWPEDSE